MFLRVLNVAVSTSGTLIDLMEKDVHIVVIFKLNQSVTEPQIRVKSLCLLLTMKQIKQTRLIKPLNHAYNTIPLSYVLPYFSCLQS